jgi:hypothetical protein
MHGAGKRALTKKNLTGRCADVTTRIDVPREERRGGRTPAHIGSVHLFTKRRPHTGRHEQKPAPSQRAPPSFSRQRLAYPPRGSIMRVRVLGISPRGFYTRSIAFFDVRFFRPVTPYGSPMWEPEVTKASSPPCSRFFCIRRSREIAFQAGLDYPVRIRWISCS